MIFRVFMKDTDNEFHDLVLEKLNHLLEEIDLEPYYKRHQIDK